MPFHDRMYRNYSTAAALIFTVAALSSTVAAVISTVAALISPVEALISTMAVVISNVATVISTAAALISSTAALICHNGSTNCYRGGDFALGFFRTRKSRTEFISHSGLIIPRETSHPSRIVLFTSGSCTAKLQRVPGLFCEFPSASRWAFFIFTGFLHDLDLNPMPQTHLPFGCCAATNMWTKIFTP